MKRATQETQQPALTPEQIAFWAGWASRMRVKSKKKRGWAPGTCELRITASRRRGKDARRMRRRQRMKGGR